MKKKIDIKRIADFITKDSLNVIAETTITIIVLAVTLAAMSRVIPQIYVPTIPGLYVFAMLIVLSIRIVRHFDDSKTNNELSEQIDERFVEMEQKLTERLDKIITNS